MKYRGHKVYFRKLYDGDIRYFIDSKNNYSGDSQNIVKAKRDAKNLIIGYGEK